MLGLFFARIFWRSRGKTSSDIGSLLISSREIAHFPDNLSMRLIALLAAMAFLAVGCIGIGAQSGSLDYRISSFKPMYDYSAAYPESFDAFRTTFYPLARSQTCVNCHHAQWTGAPLAAFADPDPQVAFNSITHKQKVNLADPESSRIVRKPIDEMHNCWSDCQANSDEILDTVKDWASQVPVTYLPADVVVK